MAFFRQVYDRVAGDYPDIERDYAYVDAFTVYQLRNPAFYDVVVAENMFGDIISDLAAATVGGMGMAPSADVGDRCGLFQPSHGTGPDIAGQGIANPLAQILSAGMMLTWLGERHNDADAVAAAPNHRPRRCPDPHRSCQPHCRSGREGRHRRRRRRCCRSHSERIGYGGRAVLQ